MSVVELLALRWRHVVAVLVEVAVVQPVDILGGGDLDRLDGAPSGMLLVLLHSNRSGI